MQRRNWTQINTDVKGKKLNAEFAEKGKQKQEDRNKTKDFSPHPPNGTSSRSPVAPPRSSFKIRLCLEGAESEKKR